MSPLTLPHFEFSPDALCHAWPFLGGIGPFPPLLTHFVFFLVQCVAIPLSAPLSLYFTFFFIVTFLKILDFGDVLVHNQLKKLQSCIFCSLRHRWLHSARHYCLLVVYVHNCWPHKDALITHCSVDLGKFIMISSLWCHEGFGYCPQIPHATPECPFSFILWYPLIILLSLQFDF